MFSILKKLFDLFSSGERRKIYFLFLASVVLGFVEMLGVLSVLPFMAVLTDPSIVESNKYLAFVYQYIEFGDINSFLSFLGMLVLVVILTSNLFASLLTWFVLRFTHMCGYNLSAKVLESYLDRPYVFHLDRNASELTKNIFLEVQRVILGVLTPLITVFSKLFVVLFISAIIVIADPVLAFVVVSVLGCAYGIVYLLVRKRLGSLGEKIVESGKQYYKAANEALGAVKEIKLNKAEEHFLRRYMKPSLEYAHSQSLSQTLTLVPRYALEALAFGGMILIILYLISNSNNLSEVIPIMAFYVLSGYRLMPAMQHILSGLSVLRNNYPSLDVLCQDLGHKKSPVKERLNESSVAVGELSFEDSLEFKHVSFNYPGVSEVTLSDISLKIVHGASIGIVGGTGSGKSTLIDLMLGLLVPESGCIYVDGRLIDKSNMDLWQKKIGYVPQSIYLTDESVKNNIAFGVAEEDIDFGAVQAAAKTAKIHDFIISDLPGGYATEVGERGVRLSGGQRQRIGLARALYRDPEILVLDEATSALDGATERQIMNELNKLTKRKTLIMVAHRMSTIKECDSILVFERGSLVDQGNYIALQESSEFFQKLSLPGFIKHQFIETEKGMEN
ncbi:MAG: ABC transporter ATP-binding protein/permease [Gammaproteobacteria bacterium]|nr:ABC transporter ATP-binding protein/permease [Gammaproteobacteria bacterium]